MKAMIVVIAVAALWFGSLAFADDQDRLMAQDRLMTQDQDQLQDRLMTQDRLQLHLCSTTTGATTLAAVPLHQFPQLRMQERGQAGGQFRAMVGAYQ